MLGEQSPALFGRIEAPCIFFRILPITVRGRQIPMVYRLHGLDSESEAGDAEKLRRCPEIEALDSRTLLSGTAAAQPITAFSTMQLTGTVHGTATDRGDPRFHLSGVLSPLGNVKDSGHGSIATVTSTNGSFSLSDQGREALGSHRGRRDGKAVVLGDPTRSWEARKRTRATRARAPSWCRIPATSSSQASANERSR